MSKVILACALWRGTKRFSRETIYEERRDAPQSRAWNVSAACLMMKPVGKPNAVNPHVRFDKEQRFLEANQSGGEWSRSQFKIERSWDEVLPKFKVAVESADEER